MLSIQKGAIMSKSTKMVTFKADAQVKEDFDAFCREVGLTVTGALTLFMNTVVRERRIPFEITADPFYSSANMRVLDQSIAAADRGEFAATTEPKDFDSMIAGL